MSRERLATLFTVLASLSSLTTANAQDVEPLVLESKIPLGEVRGRIDHLTIDLRRQRLFVAELGNNSVGVVDLNARKVIHRITDLDEPQGVAYFDQTDSLYVASGGKGTLQLFSGEELKPESTIKLGSDADNVRIDRSKQQIIVGYGSGALAIIDARSQKSVVTIALKSHPESFQFGADGSLIFVNIPNSHEIAVVDRAAAKQTASWTTNELSSNFPMAVDSVNHTVASVFRRPAKLAVYGTTDGKRLASVEVCGDADDVFVDAKRRRLYIICGEGFIDVIAAGNDSYPRIARIKTVSGARTGLFVPDLDKLFVAVRANGAAPAAVWAFRTNL